MKKSILATQAVLAALALANENTHAATIHSAQGGDWSSTSTWNGGVVPGSSDDVVIEVGHYVDVTSNVAANIVTVQDSGLDENAVLTLKASAVLNVYNKVDVRHGQTNPGIFRFSATSGTQPKLAAAATGVTLDGPFTVIGSLGGEMKSATGSETFVLASGGTITAHLGPLTISAGMQVNGLVKADAANTSNSITFTAAPLDGSAGRCEVSGNANARMYFSHSAPIQIGDTGGIDYLVTNGILRFNESLTALDGGLKISSVSGSTPKIEVAAGKTFKVCGVY